MLKFFIKTKERAMEKKFYINLFSGCWLTDDEFEYVVADYGCAYTLEPATSKSGIDGFRVVFEREVK